MLKVNQSEVSGVGEGGERGEISLESLVRLFRRKKWFILQVAGLLTGLAALYCVITTPMFKTTALLLIDSHQVPQFNMDGVGAPVVDNAMVDSQVEILKSERIAVAVLKDLDDEAAAKAAKDGEADSVKTDKSVFSNVLSALLPFLFRSQPRSEYEVQRYRLKEFAENLDVARVALSYVISITFKSSDPELAAKTANQIAEAYIVDQLESKFQATRRASVWLQERITELREQAQAADRAVQEFKVKHNIVTTGQGLVNEQQLGELNSQLIKARTDVAEMEARYERIQEILRAGNSAGFSDEVVSDVLNNEVVSRLRTQLLEAEKRASEWSARYGKDHEAVIKLRTEVDGLKRALFNELSRIAQTFRSDLDIAKARQASLNKNFDELVNQAKETSRQKVEMRELETTAETYRTLYENFLQRFMQATQQQSFPITEARVITDASRPVEPASPKTVLIVFGALFAGVVIGAIVAHMQEQLNQTMRVPGDVEQYLGLDCLGVVPKVAELPSKRSKGPGGGGDNSAGAYRFVVSEPFSRFAETLRTVKVSADLSILGGSGKVIGITSTLPKEGKSTISANLAQLIAQSGNRCVLIDGDLRNPTLTRNMVSSPQQGILEVLSGSISLDQATVTDATTGLRFLPAVVPRHLAHTNEILASAAMNNLITGLREQVDYIVVDFPPVGVVVDAVASTQFIDAYVYVLQWGSTRRGLILSILNTHRQMRAKILGCLLNMADLTTLRSLEDYGNKYHYYKYYSEYGTDA